MPIEVSADDARRVALWAQGLAGSAYETVRPTSPAAARTGAVRGVLEHLGAVQLDTISVLARSHELVPYARLGAIGRDAVEAAYWDGESSFEYWSHAACVLPMSEWPWFAFRRRHYEAKGERWHKVPQASLTSILDRLRIDGPLTTSDIGGAKRSNEWWDWSESKVGLEWLLDIGEVVVARRVGWRRVYDLAERVVPDELMAIDADDDECMSRLVALGARSVGVGTAGDIADVHRLPSTAVRRHASDAGLVEVTVPGWGQRAWASPEALTWLESRPRARHRTTLLSPFDSLIWHRDRMERVFGMWHRIEAYTPQAQRVHGYFAMPVLHGGRLVARVDPAREGRTTLVARRVTLEEPLDRAIEGTARALREATTWVGCSGIRVDDVRPATAAKALRAAI